MNPQNYSDRVSYRPSARWYRKLNKLGVALTSLGLAPRDAVTLEVIGRNSGKKRRVPVLVIRHAEEDYLVALAGESQWVKNVRASHGEAVIRRGRPQMVRLEEIPPSERPPILAAFLEAGRRRGGAKTAEDQARFYFGLDPDPSTADLRRIVAFYPVFRVHSVVRSREARVATSQ